MIFFNDIVEVQKERTIFLTDDELELLNGRAVTELAERSVLGTVLMPLCYIMVALTSDFATDSPVSALMILLGILVFAVARMYVIRKLTSKFQKQTARQIQAFFAVCIGMALLWGSVAGIFIFRYGEGFPVLLVLILSAAIGAGAVANLCIWRILALWYLIVCFVPGVAVGLWLRRPELLPAIVAIAFYAIYMMLQLRHLNFQFWESLLNSHLSQRQAEQLSETNQKLAVTLEKEKQFSQEVEVEKAKMRELFDSANDAMMVCLPDGKILDVNRTLLKMYGAERESILDKTPLQLLAVSGEPASEFEGRWRRAVEGMAEDFECLAQRGDAPPLHVHVHFRKLTWHGDIVIFATIRDIHDRKVAEKELDRTKASLSKSEAYLQAILRNVELPIYCKDLQGCFLTANASFENLCGMSCEQLQGKSDFDVFPAEISNFFCFGDSDIIASGEPLELEGGLTIGGEKKNILVHKFPLKDKQGKVYATAGICTDVTVIKQAMREAQLANEAKSEFLANMSHELRTPMHSILSFARLGLKRIEQVNREKLESYFKMIATSGDHLLKLLNDLLELSTLESTHAVYNIESNDLAQDLTAIVAEFRALMDEKEIRLVYNQSLDPVLAQYDRIKLFQVVRNLLSNALKFTPAKKEVKVAVERDFLTAHGRKRPAWKVMISDQGVGVDEAELETVFGKFVQGTKTKNGAGGVGLGLSICRRIIEDHNGVIWAEQNDPQGTKVCFLLPEVEKMS